jgi:hypothetical protein
MIFNDFNKTQTRIRGQYDFSIIPFPPTGKEQGQPDALINHLCPFVVTVQGTVPFSFTQTIVGLCVSQ